FLGLILSKFRLFLYNEKTYTITASLLQYGVIAITNNSH
ncbi:MAG: hypothetical protein ACI9QR_002132, partial [Flavobacteriaceae bacterium]